MDNGARDDLDRDLIAAMLELRSLARVRLPASSRARVDREVEAAIGRLVRERGEPTMGWAAQREEPTMRRAAPVAAAGGVRPASPAAPRPGARARAAVAWLATAALLVVTLGLGVAAFGSTGLGSTQPAALPGAVVQGGTPVGTSDTRFAVAFPAPLLPAGPVDARSTLYAVDPGIGVAYPGVAIERPMAALVWVQSGTMEFGGEHVAAHRASGDAAGASPTPGALRLGPGDAVGLELGPGRSYELRGVGPEPLVFAEFWIGGGRHPMYGPPPDAQILDHTNLPNAAILPSPGTVTMRLTRSVLPPGETLAPVEGSWQLALADQRSGSTVSHQHRGSVKNWSQAPVTVAAMTAEFREEAATSAVATPTG